MTQFDMHTTQSTTLTEKSKKFAVSTEPLYSTTDTVIEDFYYVGRYSAAALSTHTQFYSQ